MSMKKRPEFHYRTTRIFPDHVGVTNVVDARETRPKERGLQLNISTLFSLRNTRFVYSDAALNKLLLTLDDISLLLGAS